MPGAPGKPPGFRLTRCAASATLRLPSAIAETIYHFEIFARDSNGPSRMEDMRVLVGSVATAFEDVATLPEPQRSQILDPVSYAVSQPDGHWLREAGALGVVYPSVRHRGGECLGAFKPRAVGLPHQERHLKYHWNGSRIDRYFDYQQDCWITLDPPGAATYEPAQPTSRRRT